MSKLLVIAGRVRCPERHAWVDIEQCLACRALRSVEGGGRPRRLTCGSARLRWGSNAAAGSAGTLVDSDI